MKKSVMIHTKNKESLDNFVDFLKNGYNDEIKYSKEVKFMIQEFLENNWNVYLFSLDNFINNIWTNVYDIKNDKKVDFNIDKLNDEMNVIIIRVIGSVEGNFDNIKKYLLYVSENYNGLVLNDANAMLRGMTKKYLTEIDNDYLLSIGIRTIPTKIFSNTVSFDELKEEVDNLSQYLVKPLSGELSNSLACLDTINEEFLRYKENKVLGWVVQPIMEDIWNGEYQVSFLNKKPIYAQKKVYKNSLDDSIPNQKTRVLEKYCPIHEEIENLVKLIEYMEKLYNINLNICRIDFMKDKNNIPILLEFEMVNPGFFIGYMDSHDNDIRNITNNIRLYCESCIK